MIPYFTTEVVLQVGRYSHIST
ncbi:hypothetical protein IM043_gp244 [Bacillus phage SPG24]|nr:hypothetical protein IM043_gp244 [Bacillus phage SPG24]